MNSKILSKSSNNYKSCFIYFSILVPLSVYLVPNIIGKRLYNSEVEVYSASFLPIIVNKSYFNNFKSLAVLL